jgi:hypothetical protein
MKQFKSQRDFWDFQRAVHSQFRYIRAPEQETFLETVLATSKSRKELCKSGSILWRAQLGSDWKKVHGEEDVFEIPCVYQPARMKPLPGRAYEGRANAKGIPCLYLSTGKETAMSEVRPWIGSHISVGQFKLLRDVEIIDCSRTHPDDIIYQVDEPKPKDRKTFIWSLIDLAFAEPTTRNDDTGNYAATQIIAELFKSAGLGGVAYRSNFGREGYNLSLFDIDAAELVNLQLHTVEAIEFKFNDNQRFIRDKRHAFHNAHTSLGIAGHWLGLAGTMALIVIGEFITDPAKRWRAVRLAAVGTAVAYETLHTISEVRRRKEQETKLADCQSRAGG